MLDTEEVGRLETHPNPIKPYTTAEKPAESLAIPPEVWKDSPNHTSFRLLPMVKSTTAI